MRGGMGIRRDYRLLADQSDGMYYVEQTNPRVRRPRPRGRRRRRARPRHRAPGRHRRRTSPVPGKGYVLLHRDDVLSLVGAGGGGFGSPPGAAGLEDTRPSKEEP